MRLFLHSLALGLVIVAGLLIAAHFAPRAPLTVDVEIPALVSGADGGTQ